MKKKGEEEEKKKRKKRKKRRKVWKLFVYGTSMKTMAFEYGFL